MIAHSLRSETGVVNKEPDRFVIFSGIDPLLELGTRKSVKRSAKRKHSGWVLYRENIDPSKR